jgi:hypothetical protein
MSLALLNGLIIGEINYLWQLMNIHLHIYVAGI